MIAAGERADDSWASRLAWVLASKSTGRLRWKMVVKTKGTRKRGRMRRRTRARLKGKGENFEIELAKSLRVSLG